MSLDYNCRVYAYPDTAQVAVYKKTMHKNGMKKNKNFTKSHNNGDRSEEAEKHCKETSLSAVKNRIYNIRNWTYGFTTATRIDDTRCASGYLTKYITKESDRHLKNKKHYLCSRNICRTKAAYYIVEEEELLKEYGEHIVYSKNIKVKDAFQSINYYEINYESRS